jgi:hypothetical protein
MRCRRTLVRVNHSEKGRNPQATSPSGREGPSWGLMLFFVFFAMFLASLIAWAFTHRFFQPH